MATQGSPLDTIFPDVHNGTELAQFLNDWAIYLQATRRSSTRPNEIAEGGIWYRDLIGSRALMITVQGSAGLVDRELFRFEEPVDGGGKIFDGIEVHVTPEGSPPADPAQGDIWFIPEGVVDAYSGVSNWEIRAYDSGSWHRVLHPGNVNTLFPDSVGNQPSLGAGTPKANLGLQWMDTQRGVATPTVNNGLRIWNGAGYVPAWPVLAGQTMLKTGVDAGTGKPIANPDIGLAQIRTGASPAEYWFATGDDWVDLTAKVPFVTTADEVTQEPLSTTKAMSPFWSEYGVDYYRKQNSIQRFDNTRWGNLVETIGAGGNLGKIDPSLTLSTGLGYQGTFVASGTEVTTEYPTQTPQKGDYWIYLNDPSWTFTSGDLAGQTINKGEGIVLNALGEWEIVDLQLNTDAFVHRDGSLAVYGPLNYTDPLGADGMVLDYKSILFAAGITFALSSTTAPASGLRVTDAGLVGVGDITPDAGLHVRGAPANTPGKTNNMFKLAGSAFDTEWLGFRYNSALASWNLDMEENATPYTAMVIKRAGGYVGIGVEDPQFKLDVAGAGNFTGGLGVGGDLSVDQNSYLTGSVQMGDELQVVGDIQTLQGHISGVTVSGTKPTQDAGGAILGGDTAWRSDGVNGFEYRKLPDGTVELRCTSSVQFSGTLPVGYYDDHNVEMVTVGTSSSQLAVVTVWGTVMGPDAGQVTGFGVGGGNVAQYSRVRFYAGVGN
jgi:hypothetical protein